MNNLEIKIFVSSTFNDNMVSTRDAFRNEMLAKLNAIAGQIQGNVYLNDYELGIPEGTDALTVICTCLDAILESDYFIGIMGEGRGTLLSDYLADTDWSQCRYYSLIAQAIQNDFTVLELEFMCAVGNGIRSFFYWDTKRTIIDYDSSIEKFLLLHNQSIAGFESLEKLKHAVIKNLELEWNLEYDLFSSYSPQEKDTNIILSNKIRYYIPNTECIQKINDYVYSKSTQVFWITGKSGSGKSTILFDWYNSHLESYDYNILFFSAGYISSSLDELLDQILYNIECIEHDDFISGYRNSANELERIHYFKTILNELEQEYVILIDGLEHVSSHAGIKTAFCLPEHLQPNIKIIATWKDEDHTGLNYTLNKFDIESFARNFFELEGKKLIYKKYRQKIISLLQPEWLPDVVRLMLSCIIITAKYNNIESTIREFSAECEKYENPYCSYIVRLNKYFTVGNDEPLKEALLFLYHSKNGISLSLLKTVVSSGDKLTDIFNVLYFLLQKNTYNRYLLSNVYLRTALEILYHEELHDYGIRFANLNYIELLSKENNMEESYDIWEEYLIDLIQTRNIADLKHIFINDLGKIANLWYYNREILLQAFELVKDPVMIEEIKKQVMNDTDSNAPFFVSHLFYENGYFNDAIDIYEYLESNHENFDLSENDLATIFNNMGIYLSLFSTEKERSEEYLLHGYRIRKKHFLENKTAFFESCDNLFQFYWHNDKENADTYLNEVVELCETCFPKNSIEHMKCNLSRALREEDSSPLSAFTYYDQALKICDNIFERDNLQSAKIQQMKGVLYCKTKDYNMALECGLAADGIYEKKGIYNDDRFYIYNLIGEATLSLEKKGVILEDTTGASKSWFRRALQLSKEIIPENYLENLNTLLSEFPDIPEEYWSDSDK